MPPSRLNTCYVTKLIIFPDQAKRSPEITTTLDQLLVKNLAPTLFRLVWWNHIAPTRRASFADDFGDMLSNSLVHTFEDHSGNPLSPSQRLLATELCRTLFESIIGEFRNKLPAFEDSTFERLANAIVENRHASSLNASFAMQFDKWTSKIAIAAKSGWIFVVLPPFRPF